MNDLTDQQLLRSYAEDRSETAFTELVRRHVDLVYSAALRMVCDSHLAQDVTQAVFVALAKNAAQLLDRPVLSGWLHRTAQNLASKSVRTEVRRRVREQEAFAMNELLVNEPNAAWENVAPHLDAALGELSEPDRDAVLLRYFERKSAREISAILNVSEEAAQKRVNRAVERLREFFSKRNVTIGASGLVVLISANAVQSAPLGLALMISTTPTAIAGTSIITTTKTLAMTALQKAIIAATVAVVAGIGIYQVRHSSRLQTQLQTLRQQQAPLIEQLAELKSDNEKLSNQVAGADQLLSVNSERLRELLRLRGEVGMLRRRQREFEQRVAPMPPEGGEHVSTATNLSTVPVPFRIQLVLDEPEEDAEPVTNNTTGATLYVHRTPLLEYTAINSAAVTLNASTGAPEIDIEFSQEGKELFASITRDHLNKRLAIVLDGHLYSAPVIKSEISEGKVQISGNFSEDEAREIAAKMNDAIRDQ